MEVRSRFVHAPGTVRSRSGHGKVRVRSRSGHGQVTVRSRSGHGLFPGIVTARSFSVTHSANMLQNLDYQQHCLCYRAMDRGGLVFERTIRHRLM